MTNSYTWGKKSICMQTFTPSIWVYKIWVRISVFHPLSLLLLFISETNVKKATTNVSATAVSTEMTNDNSSAIIKGMWKLQCRRNSRCITFTSFLRITAIRIEATFKVYQSPKCCDKKWTLNCHLIINLIIFMSDWEEKWILDDDDVGW